MFRAAPIPLFVLIAALLRFDPVHAQETSGNAEQLLEDVERSVIEEQSERDELKARERTLAADVGSIRARLVEAARLVQTHEASLVQLEDRLVELEALEVEKAQLLEQERADFAQVLYALERLARFPPEAMIAQPSSPADTVRTAILLRSLVPEVERRAARVRYEVEQLARARKQANERREQLVLESAALEREAEVLNGLMADKRQLISRTEAERRASDDRLATLRREAGDLRSLVDRLEKDRQRESQQQQAAAQAARPTPQPSILTGKPITSRQGNLPMPVVGTLAGRFGETNENGVKLRGIRIAARSGAQVIAPHEGSIVYAGEFRGYGQLLIIEHSGGYHTLLAGMARIDSEMGGQVLSGEPVGVMGSGTAGQPVLYLEIRRGGRPINPLPWIAASGRVPQG